LQLAAELHRQLKVWVRPSDDQGEIIEWRPVHSPTLTAALGGREKYVEAQLAKRLGRTDAAAEAAAPLDAQQREEQELYGIPENLKVCGVVLGEAH